MRTETCCTVCDKLDKVITEIAQVWDATFTHLRASSEDVERLHNCDAALTPACKCLLRGQNLLGYRRYSDDVVSSCARRRLTVSTCSRIFDAMNDVRNLRACASRPSGRWQKLGTIATPPARYTPPRRLWLGQTNGSDGLRLGRHQGHGRPADPVPLAN
jgi:pyruvate carboxylase subunit B